MIAVLAVGVVSGGCTAAPAATVERFAEARVELRAWYEPAGTRSGVVVAEFTPTEPGLHLYGVDLPVDGIDGAGRPTRLEIVDSAWAPAGNVTASAEAVDTPLAGFDQPFPIYPAGPVTLRQPVERSTDADEAIAARVTFMACTDRLCFAPVVAHGVSIATR